MSRGGRPPETRRVLTSLRGFDILAFDCYGTLIDWEAGILAAVRRTLPGCDRSDDEILEAFARFESEEEASNPGLAYPRILARVHGRLAAEWDLPGDAASAEAFGASVPDWPAFPDSPEALAALHRHYRLAILSNVDRTSFRGSRERLGVEFDFVFTAEDIGSYKPDRRNFDYMLERLAEAGIARDRVLHTAQSLYHDHQPARRLGLATCWIDRRHDRPGWGATVAPEEEVPVDYRFTSLAEMARAVASSTRV